MICARVVEAAGEHGPRAGSGVPRRHHQAGPNDQAATQTPQATNPNEPCHRHRFHRAPRTGFTVNAE